MTTSLPNSPSPGFNQSAGQTPASASVPFPASDFDPNHGSPQGECVASSPNSDDRTCSQSHNRISRITTKHLPAHLLRQAVRTPRPQPRQLPQPEPRHQVARVLHSRLPAQPRRVVLPPLVRELVDVGQPAPHVARHVPQLAEFGPLDAGRAPARGERLGGVARVADRASAADVDGWGKGVAADGAQFAAGYVGCWDGEQEL
ncbi:hypothetical protein EV715DRAFT_252569, partial [Schizophyllum commune]